MPFVYVIQSGRGIIKIGKASNVRKRMRALQTAQPFPLRLLHQVEIADAGALEKAVHAKLKRSRLQGEWFLVEPGHAIATVDLCATRLRRRLWIAQESKAALRDHPGTITRNLYCPGCFRRAKAHVPLGTTPSFKCSKCGSRPLIGGIDPIRPWWEARAAARA